MDINGIIRNFSNISANVASSNGNVNIEKFLSVEGSIDKDTFPKVEKLSKQILDNIIKIVTSRGNIRSLQTIGV